MPSRRRESQRGRSPCIHRQLPRLQRSGPLRAAAVRLDARDRRGLRGRSIGRYGRHQLLRRRPAVRPPDRCIDPGGGQRLPSRRRARDLGGKRSRLLRPRHRELAGDGAGRDQRGIHGELARLLELAERRVSVSHVRAHPLRADRLHPARMGDLQPAPRRRWDHRRDEAAGSSARGAPIGRARRRDRARLARRLPVRGQGRPCPCGRSDRAGDRREPSRGSDVRILRVRPGGTVSDLDGAGSGRRWPRSGGAVTVRFSRDILEVDTTWGGVPSSFSAGGLTPFGHALKPDVTAPGSQVLSSTLPEYAGDEYAVLDGTSFSAPHVAGAAALLLQRHPSWTAAGEVGAHVDRRPGLRRHFADPGGVCAGAGGGARPGGVRRPAAHLHRPSVAVLRLPGRERGSGEPGDLGGGLGCG